MHKAPSIERIVELQRLIADFASIERMLNLAHHKRAENDTEHSYGLALTAWFLAGKIAPELNQEKVLKYALAHDIVEIYAGDTFIFADEESLNSKSEREDAALQKLAEQWPDFLELTDYAKGYKDKRDEEAKFVYAIDKMLPPILVNLGEKSAFWNKHKITKPMHDKKKLTMKQSKYIEPYYQQLIDWIGSPDYFYKDEPANPSQQI